MSLKRKEFLNTFDISKARSNPYKRLSKSDSPADLQRATDAIYDVQRAVYADQGLPLQPKAIFQQFLLREGGADYSAVVYDADAGGGPFGPYVGYIIAYPVTPQNYYSTLGALADTAGPQKAMQIVQQLEDRGKEVVFVVDLARLRTDRAKTEMAAMYADLIRQMKQSGGIAVIANVRETTSYKAIKRMEEQGLLQIIHDAPLQVYGVNFRNIVIEL